MEVGHQGDLHIPWVYDARWARCYQDRGHLGGDKTSISHGSCDASPRVDVALPGAIGQRWDTKGTVMEHQGDICVLWVLQYEAWGCHQNGGRWGGDRELLYIVGATTPGPGWSR